MLSGDGLVGENPTMNTPRLRRGRGIASSSSLVLLACIGTPIQYILFVTHFRVGAMSYTSFLGFLATCFLFF